MPPRVYVPNAPYHLTWNTAGKYPFFTEDVFCCILIDVIEYCSGIKDFTVIGYKINPDHIHLVIRPTRSYNVSQIMQSVKRMSSQNINQLIFHSYDENPFAHLDWTERLDLYWEIFSRKYRPSPFHPFHAFKWQPGFNDQRVKDHTQFKATIVYLKKQHTKHGLDENVFLFIAPSIT